MRRVQVTKAAAGAKMMYRALAILFSVAGPCASCAQVLESSHSASTAQERMVEWTIESRKTYNDPFNDVDVDVIFSKDGQSWRVPTFWRGDQRWTVRFAPPMPGDYTYRLQSTDATNPDLNGHEGRVTITAYAGSNPLLRHGTLQVSPSKRYFQQADGAPFFWLGDTWYTALSSRLPWEGFKKLTADRKSKGFTVVTLCAGLVPSPEELAPVDPGYSNEGGPVWDTEFKRINPRYFDFADRRIQYLIDAGIAPAIVGAWADHLRQMGSQKMKKHWRYVIARYGAFPVFWLGGGQVYDPPEDSDPTHAPTLFDGARVSGWSDVIRYIRAVDPYHHPLTVHEIGNVGGISLQESTLTDFDLTEPAHMGWPSIGVEVAQLNMRYARVAQRKPLVVGEIGYETIYGTHLEDFQRAAFWLAMLNGAAGRTYGAAPTFEVNNAYEPLHRFAQYTFMDWEQGMGLPGSYQIGLGAKLLETLPWWQFEPHPDWVTPRGTTLLEPRDKIAADALGDPTAVSNADGSPTEEFLTRPETLWPGGEWKARHGTFRLPYAAGVPGKIRVIYLPYFGFAPTPSTVLGLEKGVVYHAFYWDPMQGIRFDLGRIARPEPGAVLLNDRFDRGRTAIWSEEGPSKAKLEGGRLVATGRTLSVEENVQAEDLVVTVNARSDAGAGVLLRYQNADNYVAAVYSAEEKLLYLYSREKGIDHGHVGVVSVPALGAKLSLSAEIRSNFAAASVTDGAATYSTPIVDILGGFAFLEPDKRKIKAGRVGIFHPDDGLVQHFDDVAVRQSPILVKDAALKRKVYDAQGVYRGELTGPGWDEYGKHKAILLDSYRPERLPTFQDWVLILSAGESE
jgi:hypothetical protein